MIKIKKTINQHIRLVIEIKFRKNSKYYHNFFGAHFAFTISDSLPYQSKLLSINYYQVP